MSETFVRGAYPLPIDHARVEADWRAEGFSFGVFRDPPGQEWNGFVHATDEYVLVAEGRLLIQVAEEQATAEPGDLVRIPEGAVHSLKTLSDSGSVWLYGYGHWSTGLG